MKLSIDDVLLLLFIALSVFVIFAIIVRWNKLHNFRRALSINFLCSACFAGTFVRVGWDKALVAFLFIFVITSLFSGFKDEAQRRRKRSTSSKLEQS